QLRPRDQGPAGRAHAAAVGSGGRRRPAAAPGPAAAAVAAREAGRRRAVAPGAVRDVARAALHVAALTRTGRVPRARTRRTRAGAGRAARERTHPQRSTLAATLAGIAADAVGCARARGGFARVPAARIPRRRANATTTGQRPGDGAAHGHRG